MDENLLSDPRAVKVQKFVKVGGTLLVVGAASAVVVTVGMSIISASVVAVGCLFMVNFVVPVTARSVALWRMNVLTKLSETFSEETIREDEEKEGERIKVLEKQYTVSRAELEGAQEELEKQTKGATAEERDMLKDQVSSIQGVIDDAEETLKQRKVDFTELQRVNKLYIALHRSANALQKAHGAERNTEEIQRIEIARSSIKNKMREAMAGKTIDSMNSALKKSPSLLEESKSIAIMSPRKKKEAVDA